jgi:hypothetical protein
LTFTLTLFRHAKSSWDDAVPRDFDRPLNKRGERAAITMGVWVKRNGLTFDHVVPRSRGGRTSWENVVTACGPCNLRKGNRLPRECQMIPRQAPRQPTSWELQENGRSFPPNYFSPRPDDER